MPESSLTPTGIKLYGRVVSDILLVADARARLHAAGASARVVNAALPQPSYNRVGQNKFLERQLTAEGATLARIYGFSY